MKSHLLREFIRESLNGPYPLKQNFVTLDEIKLTGPSGSMGPISGMNGINQDVLAYKSKIDTFLKDNSVKIANAIDSYKNIGPSNVSAAPLIKELYLEASKIDQEFMVQTATFPAAIAVITYKLSESWDNVLQAASEYAVPALQNVYTWAKGFFTEDVNNIQRHRRLEHKYELLGVRTKQQLNEAPFDADAAARLLINAYIKAGGDMDDASVSNIRRTLQPIARALAPGKPVREAWLMLGSRNPSHAAMRAALQAAIGESPGAPSRSDSSDTPRPSSSPTSPTFPSSGGAADWASWIGGILKSPVAIMVYIAIAGAIASDAAMGPWMAKEMDKLNINDMKKKYQRQISEEMKDISSYFEKQDDSSMSSALSALADAIKGDSVTPAMVQAVIEASGA